MKRDKEPIWIEKEQALYLHEEIVRETGGLSGIRDEGLIESALDRPKNAYAYGQDDIFELASYYAEGVSKNHPFLDGNKRTAYVIADLFLYENGYDLDIKNEKEQIKFFEDLAAGKISREEVAEFYRQNTQGRKKS